MQIPHRSGPNKVLLTLLVAGLLATLTTGFVTAAPNRLVSGTPLALWLCVPGPTLIALGVAAAALTMAAFGRHDRWSPMFGLAAALALLLTAVYGAGEAAAIASMEASPAARFGLGPAFWAIGLAAALAVVDALQRLRSGAALKVLVLAAVIGALAGMAETGFFDQLSLVREFEIRRQAFGNELWTHCVLVVTAVAFAIAIGVPLGVLVSRKPRLAPSIFGTLNVLQTIPSVALFGILIVPLSALAEASPMLASAGIRGIGFAPATIALVLYSLLPVVRNTHAALSGVAADVIEAARGMGFAPHQLFWRVEVPLAAPILLAGLRIVVVQAIGLTVVAALIGAGGLGTFVFQGLGQYATDLILLGAIPAILLALVADFALALTTERMALRRAR